MKGPRSTMELSDKENMHPNMMLPTTVDPKADSGRNYPKVSCFGSIGSDEHDPKDWRKRILSISDRERALNSKLLKMMKKINSPEKHENYKLATEACSNNKNSQKLGNTLRRYLHENSQSSLNITFTSGNLGEMLEQLQKTTEEIVGSQIIVSNAMNPEQILVGVLEALKQYSSTHRKISKQKQVQMEGSFQ